MSAKLLRTRHGRLDRREFLRAHLPRQHLAVPGFLLLRQPERELETVRFADSGLEMLLH